MQSLGMYKLASLGNIINLFDVAVALTVVTIAIGLADYVFKYNNTKVKIAVYV